jgi:hypothetical protein
MMPEIDSHLTGLLEAGALTIEAAGQLARHTDDREDVAEAAVPIAAWLMAYEGDADLHARTLAVKTHLKLMRLSMVTHGKAWTETPEDFIDACTGHYQLMIGPLGYDQIHASTGPPALAGRLLFAVRNLILAATEPESRDGHDGWPQLVARADRYSGHASPPITPAEYDDAIRILFRGEARAGLRRGRPDTAGYADPADPGTWPFPRPGTPEALTETVYAALAGSLAGEVASGSGFGPGSVRRLARQVAARLRPADVTPPPEVSIVLSVADDVYDGGLLGDAGLLIDVVFASVADAAGWISDTAGAEIHTLPVAGARLARTDPPALPRPGQVTAAAAGDGDPAREPQVHAGSDPAPQP